MVGWYKKIIDWLLPARCVGCARVGTWWCPDCQERVVLIQKPTYPSCHRLTPCGQYCQRCRRRTSLTGILAGAYFHDPLPAAIKALKYRQAKAVVPALATYQTAALRRLPGARRAVLVPVPLHPNRLRSRGHNQAGLLAKAVSQHSNVPVQNLLARIRDTRSQTGLRRHDRQQNVARAFRCQRSSATPWPSLVILVDDVATTGATLNACASACREAGTRQVWGLVVAQR